MKFQKITAGEENTIQELSTLATEIMREHYDPITGHEQNDYMLRKFQSVPALTEQIEGGYEYYFVIDEDKKVGFMAFYPRENHIYLSKFYLHKNLRGRGISRKMLQFVAEQGKKGGFPSIVLNVNKYNDAVLAYEKLGFKRIREEKIDIGGGYFMDDYVYEYVID